MFYYSGRGIEFYSLHIAAMKEDLPIMHHCSGMDVVQV
jgi:hypothetical protein